MLLISIAVFAQKQIVVAQDGSGNFKSIQQAVNSLSADATEQRVIFIKKGIYNEKIFIEKNYITLKGESTASVQIVISEARDIFRCSNKDDWGVATLNLKGSDINLENLTFINNYGFEAKEDITIPCAADSVQKEKVIKKNGHQMALRSFTTTRLKVINCVFRALGGDTVSPWNTEDGMFYFKNCLMEGGVDFYCPRGWALAEDCQFICHSMEAAIWHDGSKYEKSKTVLINCTFKGDDGFKLGRYHRDAQFYLINCHFPANMANADIYQREANPPNVIQWGKRVYYFNCKKDGEDYDWYKNNLPNGVDVNDINAAWVFDYKWNPKHQPGGTENDLDENKNAPVAVNQTTDPVADNMLLYQRKNGGWPKHFHDENVDYKKQLSVTELNDLKAGYEEGIDATIDNGATTKEIKYLVKAYSKFKKPAYLKSATAGINYLLNAQYKGNGGWPQFYPDVSGYRNAITYNDNAMVNVLNLLYDVAVGDNGFDVIDTSFINKCALALQRGITCILKTQIVQNGKLTAWCAQHDPVTLKPVMARKFELESISGQESVGIIRFLMRIDNPGKQIITAITSAAEWLEKVKITGYNWMEVKAPKESSGRDRVLVADSNSTIWARFYDLQSNEPFFCGRDSKRKKYVSEIENERRVGYAWYGTWPAVLLQKEYPEWKKKWIK